MSTELRTEEITVRRVTFQDLQEYALAVYGQELDLIQAMEWHNDTCYMVQAEELPEDDSWWEQFNAWRDKGEHQYGIVYGLMADLLQKGLIEPGDYLIDVSW